MRNLSHILNVSTNVNGNLTFSIETNVVKLSAHFPDVVLASFIGPQNTSQNEEIVSCTLDIKKFIMFFSGLQINNCKTMCSIVHHKMVKFFMEQPGALSIQIFLTEITL